ncbi:hypothetical protein HZC27_01670 [Candidatus Roizmanbacteria bacterium]|nr:hypothetical protein [Candidatus Roizmanbacteria bacterium]
MLEPEGVCSDDRASPGVPEGVRSGTTVLVAPRGLAVPVAVAEKVGLKVGVADGLGVEDTTAIGVYARPDSARVDCNELSVAPKSGPLVGDGVEVAEGSTALVSAKDCAFIAVATLASTVPCISTGAGEELSEEQAIVALTNTAGPTYLRTSILVILKKLIYISYSITDIHGLSSEVLKY